MNSIDDYEKRAKRKINRQFNEVLKKSESQIHIPVMYKEVMKAFEYLLSKSGYMFDCTLGLGGHSYGFLSMLHTSGSGILYSIDRDLDSIAVANEKLNLIDPRGVQHKIIHGPFSKIKEYIKEQGLKDINGAFFDLGVSSPQLDNPFRGFSYKFDAPLDMRMDQHDPYEITAADLVNTLNIDELIDLFSEYTDERLSREIAIEICLVREKYTIHTTGQLEEICKKVYKKHNIKKSHTAAKIFTALRIAVNKEYDEIIRGLVGALESMAIGGRVGIITFSQEEDALVKSILKTYTSKYDELQYEIFDVSVREEPEYKWVVKKCFPSEKEIEENPRAHSAILRVVERQYIRDKFLDFRLYRERPYKILDAVERVREEKRRYYTD